MWLAAPTVQSHCQSLSHSVFNLFEDLLAMSKRCLDNNFISSVLTLAGGIIVFHYESIIDLQDECPLILCYSRKSGTGELT